MRCAVSIARCSARSTWRGGRSSACRTCASAARCSTSSPSMARSEGRNLDHFCFRVEPFDKEAIVAHLEKCGVEVGEIRPRFGAEGSGVSIYLTDPEGNLVELKGPSDGKKDPPGEFSR